MIARNYADGSGSRLPPREYWVASSFPDLSKSFLSRSERFANFEARAHVADPPRPRARAAFTEFFFSHARRVSKYGFARMTDDEFGRTVALA